MELSSVAQANQYTRSSDVSMKGVVQPAYAVRPGRAVNVSLWIVQGLLAFTFLFSGGFKLALPLEVLTAQFPLPGLLVRFVALCEVLGALGLVLPGLTRVRPGLTPLAAAGLVIIMAGATILTVASGMILPAFLPLAVGMLAASVAYGRRSSIRTLFR